MAAGARRLLSGLWGRAETPSLHHSPLPRMVGPDEARVWSLSPQLSAQWAFCECLLTLSSICHVILPPQEFALGLMGNDHAIGFLSFHDGRSLSLSAPGAINSHGFGCPTEDPQLERQCTGKAQSLCPPGEHRHCLATGPQPLGRSEQCVGHTPLPGTPAEPPFGEVSGAVLPRRGSLDTWEA